MANDEPATAGQLQQLIRSASAVIAPTTVISGLLFYFGYAFTKAQYEYFGLDVETIGLSTRDYVMRSPTPLLLPTLVLAVIGAGLTLIHSMIRRRIIEVVGTESETSADTEDVQRGVESRRRLVWARRLTRAALVLGRAAVTAGAALLFLFAQGALREWIPLPLATALSLSLGAALCAYALRLEVQLGRRDPLRGATVVALSAVVVGGVFWATATIAPFIGRGEAHSIARHLDRLPSVILDTQERLYLRSPGVSESALEDAKGQTFHYRYRRLRLLIQGGDRMFLVPDTWTASNSTLVVPADDTVRVQFQFQNQVP
jgi:uncharacterized membrane protein YedE/YeeE